MKPVVGMHTSGALAYWHDHWEGRSAYAGWKPLYTADQLRDAKVSALRLAGDRADDDYTAKWLHEMADEIAKVKP